MCGYSLTLAHILLPRVCWARCWGLTAAVWIPGGCKIFELFMSERCRRQLEATLVLNLTQYMYMFYSNCVPLCNKYTWKVQSLQFPRGGNLHIQRYPSINMQVCCWTTPPEEFCLSITSESKLKGCILVQNHHRTEYLSSCLLHSLFTPASQSSRVPPAVWIRCCRFFFPKGEFLLPPVVLSWVQLACTWLCQVPLDAFGCDFIWSTWADFLSTSLSTFSLLRMLTY